MTQPELRPLARTIIRLDNEGMPVGEIAWRFRRSPGHISRILEWSELPRTAQQSPEAEQLRVGIVASACLLGTELPVSNAHMFFDAFPLSGSQHSGMPVNRRVTETARKRMKISDFIHIDQVCSVAKVPLLNHTAAMRC